MFNGNNLYMVDEMIIIYKLIFIFKIDEMIMIFKMMMNIFKIDEIIMIYYDDYHRFRLSVDT